VVKKRKKKGNRYIYYDVIKADKNEPAKELAPSFASRANVS
jgi:hypothetical protein